MEAETQEREVTPGKEGGNKHGERNRRTERVQRRKREKRPPRPRAPETPGARERKEREVQGRGSGADRHPQGQDRPDVKYKDEGAGLDNVTKDKEAEQTVILKVETEYNKNTTETQGTGDTGGRGAERT